MLPLLIYWRTNRSIPFLPSHRFRSSDSLPEHLVRISVPRALVMQLPSYRISKCASFLLPRLRPEHSAKINCFLTHCKWLISCNIFHLSDTPESEALDKFATPPHPPHPPPPPGGGHEGESTATRSSQPQIRTHHCFGHMKKAPSHKPETCPALWMSAVTKQAILS
jgi:hypothetical protein